MDKHLPIEMTPHTSVYQRRAGLRRAVRGIADVLSRVSPRHLNPLPGPPARIGVFLQWGIGDAILALPLLEGLRITYPEASIELIGKPWLADLFDGEAYVDRTHVLVPPWTKYHGKYRIWEAAWQRFARQLWALRWIQFDLLISLRLDPREVIQLRLLRAREVMGFKCGGGRRWITRDIGLTSEKYDNRHRSEVSAYALEALTGLTRSSIPQFTVNEAGRAKALKRLREAGYRGGPILAVHSEAGNPIRGWGPENFGTVLQTLPDMVQFVVVIDGGSDKPKNIRVPESVPSCVWHSSLTDLKGLLFVCDVILCSDSGIMHIAAACGCRVVAVFGPTLIDWFGPSGEGHEVVQVEPMPCRPCFERCIYSTPICMERISSEAVLAALVRVTEGARTTPPTERVGSPFSG